MLRATARQLAFYIERDGATVVPHGDGSQTVSVPALGGTITYEVPARFVDELNAERDPLVAERRRQDALRAAGVR